MLHLASLPADVTPFPCTCDVVPKCAAASTVLVYDTAEIQHSGNTQIGSQYPYRLTSEEGGKLDLEKKKNQTPHTAVNHKSPLIEESKAKNISKAAKPKNLRIRQPYPTFCA